MRDNEIDYHALMKEYYDRLAPEYEEHEAFREEAAEDPPVSFTRSRYCRLQE
jgi:hypothetical protein